MWQHVCTAEHKLKKPRPLSHTPLGPKLHGVLHSTHKQPPGTARDVWERQGDAKPVGKKQQLPFHISTMPPNYREKRWRQRGLGEGQKIHAWKFLILRLCKL